MAQTTVSLSEAPSPLGLPQRLLGIIVSPGPTFQSVVARPVWFDVMAVTLVVIAVAWFAFLSTDVGRQASIDNQLQEAERWGQTITPQVEQRAVNMAPMMRFITPAAILVIVPLSGVVIAGLIHVIFGAMLGGGGTFRQAFAVVAHAGVVSTVVGLFVLILNYSQESMSSRTNLGVFVPMLPEESFVARFLGMLDLQWVWYLVVLAIGLGVLYRRKASTIAFSFFGIYVVIALIVAGARSALGGS
jgi:hypothetical protein